MNPERYEQVKRLFLAACELDECRVAEFLDHQCPDDPQLRQEVESLLKHHRPTTIVHRPDGKVGQGRLPGAVGGEETAPPSPFTPTEREPEERFPPGTVLAGRYRMLGLLGSGGMGEVYRADDLELRQSVALKFLLPGASNDQVWLDRFRNEVRLARKVTHPNVNRIHDLDVADGKVFISMEYVDGENLASLMGRVGRLPAAKVLQITRELCAGLAAAHDQGVLHRDLKPTNIMLDGQGHVRITDFGIAALVPQPGSQPFMAGTPAYMAPELFTGQPPSVQSDLYSLGVVLYQLVTGREPFACLPAPQDKPEDAAGMPSNFAPDMDPNLERLILQCLEKDPAQRPESAHVMAAALPGYDPLAAALAAGVTPTPGMVAAAGVDQGLRPATAFSTLAVALIGLIAIVLLADHTLFLPQAGLVKNPAVLADTAENVIRDLARQPADNAATYGFTVERHRLERMMRNQELHGVQSQRTLDPLPAVFFWYRQGDRRLRGPAPLGESALMRTLPPEPGVSTVKLDGQGRLLELVAVPAMTDFQSTSEQSPNWKTAFQFAAFDIHQFHAASPTRTPPVYADQVAAWEGPWGQDPKVPIRVEGAARGERIVYFQWWPMSEKADESSGSLSWGNAPARILLVRVSLYAIALLGGSILARRNLSLGRGDHQGAGWLARLVFGLGMLKWAFGEQHSWQLNEEIAAAYLWITAITFTASVSWICYIGIEPFVRRLWPRTMITWSRLVTGHYRDPLVGRDILIGGLFGIGVVLLLQADSLFPIFLGAPHPVLKLPGAGPVVGYELGELLGMRYKLGTLVSILLHAILLGLVILLIMLLLRVLVRRPLWAGVIFCVIFTALSAAGSDFDVYAPGTTSALMAAGVTLVLTRFGLVALMVGLFVQSLILVNPITSDLQAWYSAASSFTLAVIGSMIFFGYYAATKGCYERANGERGR